MTNGTVRLFVLASLFLFLQGRCFSSDKKIPPTFALDSSVKLPRGSDVEITLSAVPSYGSRILFEITTQPLHGVLSELKSSSDHTAMVVYHHDGSRSPTVDEFAFRAQAPGQSKSSAAKVSIRLLPPPARLVFEPRELNFGELPLGDKIGTNIVMTNRGGIRAAGRLILPNGFSAPEGDRYDLDEGESTIRRLEFCPMEERDYSTQANTLPPVEKDPLALHGKGTPRIEVTKLGPVEWVIKNLSKKPFQLSFSGGVGWIIPIDTLLNSGMKMRFSFQQADQENQDQSVHESSLVHVSDGLSSRDLELPPVRRFIPVTIQSISLSSLGKIPIGCSIPVEFSLLNRSEFPKHMTWKATSAAGGGSSSPVPLELLGGEVRNIRFDWKPSFPGIASLNVSVEEGTKTHRELTWIAEVILPAVSDSSLPSSGIIPIQDQNPVVDAVIQDQPPGVSRNIIPIPPLDNVSWEAISSWSGKPRIKLTWEAKEGDESTVQIDERVMRIKGNNKIPTRIPSPTGQTFGIVFTPVEHTPGNRMGSRMVCELTNLQSGWHLIQLGRIARGNNPEARSQLQVCVPSRKSFWSTWKTPLGILTIILLILFLRASSKWRY